MRCHKRAFGGQSTEVFERPSDEEIREACDRMMDKVPMDLPDPGDSFTIDFNKSTAKFPKTWTPPPGFVHQSNIPGDTFIGGPNAEEAAKQPSLEDIDPKLAKKERLRGSGKIQHLERKIQAQRAEIHRLRIHATNVENSVPLRVAQLRTRLDEKEAAKQPQPEYAWHPEEQRMVKISDYPLPPMIEIENPFNKKDRLPAPFRPRGFDGLAPTPP
jgi:hypothetical protein